MFEVNQIHAAYGKVKILRGITFNAKAGEIVSLVGRNGAGKTTTMKSIMGLLPVSSGKVYLAQKDLTNTPAHLIPREGLGYIPQGRRLFQELNVEENIEIGLMTCNEGPETREWILELFPRLAERLKQSAGTLSGGEQQMLATARALCLRPKVLLLDEVTEGLQPSMIELILEVIIKMKAEGIAIVLVEQRMDIVLSITDQTVFIENGKSVDRATPAELSQEPGKITYYLGV